jgi:hypothetical protein
MTELMTAPACGGRFTAEGFESALFSGVISVDIGGF